MSRNGPAAESSDDRPLVNGVNNNHGSSSANGLSDEERAQRKGLTLRRSPFRALVQDFEPIWFTICMNSGIIGILLHQFPYQFNGIGVLATIAFTTDFVLFFIFSAIFLARLLIYRWSALDELLDNANNLALTGCWPIAAQTVTSFISLVISNTYWGGHRFTIVAYVMWWFVTTWMILTLLFVFIGLTLRHKNEPRKLPPSIVIPAVGVVTMATVGGLVSSYSFEISPQLAIPIIIFSFFLTGTGFLMALILYSILFNQLLANGFPPPEQIASMFLFVGPMGQSAAAILLLGSSAQTYGNFAGFNRGTFLTAAAAQPLDVACVFVALMIAGLGLIWLFLALFAMGYTAYKREIVWTMTWNGIIFPTGTFTTAMLLFSISMNSDFFRVITAILLTFMVLMFFVNLAFIFWQVATGKLLVVREDPRVKKQIEEDTKQD